MAVFLAASCTPGYVMIMMITKAEMLLPQKEKWHTKHTARSFFRVYGYSADQRPHTGRTCRSVE